MVIRFLSATTLPVLGLTPAKNCIIVLDLKDLTIVEVYFIAEKRESA